MDYEINGTLYKVDIIRKNNKNTYVRITDDLTIQVTTNHLTTRKYIRKILDENNASIVKMLNRQEKRIEKSQCFFYLDKSYDIIEISIIDDIEFDGDKIYIPNRKKFDKWYKSQIQKVFDERLDYNFKIFDELSICPILKIRTMKTRWGVYNKVKHSITLNSKLIEYGYEEIDYVIIHELSHTIHFNHSKDFWNLVEKYCPNYKKIRKKLKE